MGQVIRVSLPGYNALTETNPDRFALYSDEDWVLIKEYTRGSISADLNGQPFYYYLDYIPTIFAYYQDGGIWRSVTGESYDMELFPGQVVKKPYILIIHLPGSSVGAIYFLGDSSALTNFKFFICYDNQV